MPRGFPWTCAKDSLSIVYAALNPTSPGAYVMACQVRPGPYFTLDKLGLEVQKRVWHEMV
ncbi:hypothetical protein B0H17DRAFT_1195498 [Mycena rosella]|uniref:Uncharacterized protein n=1 Tax=Mycena rosella TaxID=1033263 RepID=A0AAD7GPI3_MYCRO|nr:hypothetical protein B0H17DRAFT_1195498 [Mycena rosella]